MRIIPEPYHFEWDEGNREKNLIKHEVTLEECEEAFYDPHKRIFSTPHDGEERFLLLAKTSNERFLFLVFTMRKQKIRVISARDLNKKERGLYEKDNQAA